MLAIMNQNAMFLTQVTYFISFFHLHRYHCYKLRIAGQQSLWRVGVGVGIGNNY